MTENWETVSKCHTLHGKVRQHTAWLATFFSLDYHPLDLPIHIPSLTSPSSLMISLSLSSSGMLVIYVSSFLASKQLLALLSAESNNQLSPFKSLILLSFNLLAWMHGLALLTKRSLARLWQEKPETWLQGVGSKNTFNIIGTSSGQRSTFFLLYACLTPVTEGRKEFGQLI